MDNYSGKNVRSYQFAEKLGEGGFGAVYRAQQAGLREVAVKVITPKHANDPDFIRRFEKEAQIVARLEHPHIVRLYDYWRDATGAYLIMQFLQGGSLEDLIEQGPLDLDRAVTLLCHIAEGLDFAHRHKVIHRDIKPANIMLDEDGRAYVADFGIAKDTTSAASATESGNFAGTPAYVSPEQLQGMPLSTQSDIYCLGIMLYQMVTGELPFKGSVGEIVMKHINEPIPEITCIPAEVQFAVNDVLQKATEKTPDERYDSTVEFAEAFRQAVNAGEAVLSVGQPADPLLFVPTARELEILSGLVRGLRNTEIAAELHLSEGTVRNYLTEIYRKLDVRSRNQAREYVLKHGLMDSDGAVLQPSIPVQAAPVPLNVINPYKGLQAFTYADADDFFGREALTSQLVERLAQPERFLAVVGGSGSGKSSVVKAGLLPALGRGELPGADRWFVVEMLPKGRPLDELEVLLQRKATNIHVNVGEQLQRDAHGLVRVAAMLLPDDGSELLLVIDQFEEVFTLVNDEAERQHFLDLITTAVTADNSRVRVVITLRADFFDRPLRYPRFGDLLRRHMETVLPLTAEELEQAIVRPATAYGIQYETGLVTTMVKGVLDQPGGLPLLQYALTELFERREEQVIPRSAYDAIKGVTGALAREANALYEEQDDTGQKLIQQMFLRLVTPGEGTEDSRRRANREELLSLTSSPDLMSEIIDAFVERRLLATDHDAEGRQPTVEVAHEALLREWERLRKWIDYSRAEVHLVRQVEQLTTRWQASGRDAAYLEKGGPLADLEPLLGSESVRLTPGEKAFLEASLDERQRQKEIDEARKAREERNARLARTFRRASVVLGVMVVLALGTGIFAIDTASNARSELGEIATQVAVAEVRLEEGEARIESLRLAAEALSILNAPGGNAETAALLAIRGLQTAYTPQADAALVQMSAGLYTTDVLSGHTGGVESASYSPEGDYIVTASSDVTARVRDAATGEQVRVLSGHTDRVTSAAYSPDGRFIVTASWDNTARVWDAATGEAVRVLSGHTRDVNDASYSPDGRFIVTASWDDTARVWDASSGEEVRALRGHTRDVTSAAYSPDGRFIVTASLDGTARVWDAATGEQVRVLRAAVSSASYSPNGRFIVTSGGITARVWDAASGEQVRVLRGHTSAVSSASYSPNGRFIITASRDNTARIWDAATGEAVRVLSGHTRLVNNAAYSPDGRFIVTASGDNTARVWVSVDTSPTDTANSEEVPVPRVDTSSINSAAYSPDGRFIVTASGDDTARVWDAATGEAVRVLSGHTNSVHSAAYSPDGRFIVTASWDNTARVWDATSGAEVRVLSAHTSSVNSAAYSPDGRFIVTASGDDTARVWDAATGEAVRVLSGHTNSVLSASYSPDGRFIVTASSDDTARVWDAATGEENHVLNGHTFGVSSASYSPDPDGSFIVTASWDGTARVWDAATGQEVHVLSRHTDRVNSAMYSPDGRFIVTASGSNGPVFNNLRDDTVRVWDAISGAEVRVLRGHTDEVNSVTYSPDGSFIVTASSDGTVRVWDADYRDFIAYVCTRVFRRDFTDRERAQYGIPDDEPTCPGLAQG